MATSEDSTEPKNPRIKKSHKVFDVEKPGKSVPSQNSRPAILTHSALPHDPMVANDDMNSFGDTISEAIKDLTEEPDEIKKRSEKSTITPIASEAPSEEEEAPVSEETSDTKEVEAVAVTEPETEPEQEPEKDTIELKKDSDEPTKTVKHTGMVVEPISEKTEKEPDAPKKTEDEIDEINEFAGQAAAKTAKKTEDEAEQKRIQAANELVENKKYFVHISAHQGRNIVLWLLIIVLVLVVAGAIGYMYIAT